MTISCFVCIIFTLRMTTRRCDYRMGNLAIGGGMCFVLFNAGHGTYELAYVCNHEKSFEHVTPTLKA